jgi:hypothetical protein
MMKKNETLAPFSDRIITPYSNPSIPYDIPAIGDDPVMYLAGPTWGAPKWRQQAISHIRERDKNVWIINPEFTHDEELSLDFLKTLYDPRKKKDLFPARISQTNIEYEQWNFKVMDLTVKQGIAAFWLLKTAIDDHTRGFGVSAQTVLGYFIAMHRVMDAELAVGVQDFYNNTPSPKMKQYRYTVKNEMKTKIAVASNLHIPVHDTLEATLDDALNRVRLMRTKK